MIKKLFTYLTLLMAMSACSVEEIDAPSGLGPDGELSVTLAVPEMETVGTRADENTLSDVTMLVLAQQKVEQVTPITLSTENNLGNNQYKIKQNIDLSLRSKTGLKIYFIANLRSNVTTAQLKGLTEAQLMALPTAYFTNTSDKIMMSGARNLNEITAGNPVVMKRNAAKITVSDDAKNEKGEFTFANPYPFEVYGAASSSSIVAGSLENMDYASAAHATTDFTFTGKTSAYLHHTANPGRNVEARPFIIVKAKYPAVTGPEYYYRLEFEKYDETTKKIETLNILPNHHYQVIITKVEGKGYTTPEEAAKNPSSLIMATIYDYTPQVYNMITDGLRELGVSAQVLHNGNPTTGGTPKYLYIKLYTPDENDYGTPSESIKVSSNVSWLTLGSPGSFSYTETPLPGAENFKGKLYRVSVHFNQTRDPGELRGTITVRWKGLEREVPVIWTRDFDASEICTVQLNIKDNDGTSKFSTGNTKGNDYWSFIRNTNQIDGLSVKQNNGKVRNEGFHFPVNYGGESARWTYEYKITFNNLNDNNAYDWKVSAEGLNGLSIKKDNAEVEQNKVFKGETGTVTLTVTHNNTSDNWDYKIGQLKFEISKPNENVWTLYDFDLYHTGFFDNPKRFRPETNHRMDQDEKNLFYYYEVVKGPGSNDYWLDRNLGATSAEYYIEMSTGDPYTGNQEAAGGYYSVAKYVNGGTPELFSDLCPPGFEIPKVETWNTLRNSPDFVTSASGANFRAEYTNAAGQKIYFPRGRFYNCDAAIKTGELNSGYYWSQTAANGLEKDQIGNWLRYLKFSGNIASYDNGQVAGRRNSKGSAMSVRCVNTTPATTHVYRTYFYVSGATHVFLYSLDAQGNRNAVTNWPGQAIGNYSTMGNATGTGSGTQKINFNYESPNTLPQDFYVLFTFRDINGIWHTMSKGDNGETVYSTDKNPRDLKGWKVVGDTWVDEYGNSKTTALNGNWKCNFNGTSAKVTYSDPGIIPPVIDPVENEITVIYTNPNNWGQVYIYAWKGDGEVKNAVWPGVLMTKISDHEWTYKLNRSLYEKIIFNNGSGAQTDNIILVQEDNHEYSQGQGQSVRRR